MGVTSSSIERVEQSEATWLVEHCGIGSPWSRFALRRYGAGLAATGVAASIALPRLLRRKLQDWAVLGCGIHLGSNFVSFGRQLSSMSRGDSELFYGVDIIFGDNSERSSWIWYCRAQEWLLQLNKAILEPLPAPIPQAAAVVAQQRWPGQPRFLGEDQPPNVETRETRVGDQAHSDAAMKDAASPKAKDENDRFDGSAPSGEAGEGTDPVEHQLSLFFSNADGHVGLLILPVPCSRVEATSAIVERWQPLEVPLIWAGRRWITNADFARLRETALNMPDLLLLGMETDLATALTPDWTWEKYPRGYGDAALPPEHESDSEEALLIGESMIHRADSP